MTCHTYAQPPLASPMATHGLVHTGAHTPACSLSPCTLRGTHPHLLDDEKRAHARRFKDICKMDFKIHQTPSSGSACMILWTKYDFSLKRCWASDPDGLYIHLLKSYFTVLKLAFSPAINRKISSFLLVGILAPGLQWGLG